MEPELIFVFGSNLAGRHGKGAALCAKNVYGAVRGVGEGRTGSAYAIPTKDSDLRRLSMDSIKKSVEQFVAYARSRQDLRFLVTRVGCGLAGNSEDDMKVLFASAPRNCELPSGWRAGEAITRTLECGSRLIGPYIDEMFDRGWRIVQVESNTEAAMDVLEAGFKWKGWSVWLRGYQGDTKLPAMVLVKAIDGLPVEAGAVRNGAGSATEEE